MVNYNNILINNLNDFDKFINNIKTIENIIDIYFFLDIFIYIYIKKNNDLKNLIKKCNNIFIIKKVKNNKVKNKKVNNEKVNDDNKYDNIESIMNYDKQKKYNDIKNLLNNNNNNNNNTFNININNLIGHIFKNDIIDNNIDDENYNKIFYNDNYKINLYHNLDKDIKIKNDDLLFSNSLDNNNINNFNILYKDEKNKNNLFNKIFPHNKNSYNDVKNIIYYQNQNKDVNNNLNISGKIYDKKDFNKLLDDYSNKDFFETIELSTNNDDTLVKIINILREINIDDYKIDDNDIEQLDANDIKKILDFLIYYLDKKKFYKFLRKIVCKYYKKIENKK